MGSSCTTVLKAPTRSLSLRIGVLFFVTSSSLPSEQCKFLFVAWNSDDATCSKLPAQPFDCCMNRAQYENRTGPIKRLPRQLLIPVILDYTIICALAFDIVGKKPCDAQRDRHSWSTVTDLSINQSSNGYKKETTPYRILKSYWELPCLLLERSCSYVSVCSTTFHSLSDFLAWYLKRIAAMNPFARRLFTAFWTCLLFAGNRD